MCAYVLVQRMGHGAHCKMVARSSQLSQWIMSKIKTKNIYCIIQKNGSKHPKKYFESVEIVNIRELRLGDEKGQRIATFC